MAFHQWHHSCSISFESESLTLYLEQLGMSLCLADWQSGVIFAEANPTKKTAGEDLRLLISWSPQRSDGYLVEVRSSEPQRSRNRNRAALLSDALKAGLPKVFCQALS
ncbi:hypothetical protein KBY58_08230 [Cyanobium sp. HWJ4-Hawea]|uniref:hypothetical protein n=1 Tax=unclassified Cyanobium TaxID=2627006 RepID=UPI0020CC427D|nr:MULTISPECIES: hypothetical protein [unclassified Cyanobium]MCP9774914.1 hypothetical protein [Cyanobium sp. WAJ14-Wanaka]MCP9809419.1 hypothetical protein [Cyanobium sp. HWJ4-Hawea]